MTAARSGAKTTPRRHDSILFAALMVAALAFGSARALAADETLSESGIRFVASNLLSTADGTFHDWRITDMSVDLQDQVSGWAEFYQLHGRAETRILGKSRQCSVGKLHRNGMFRMA